MKTLMSKITDPLTKQAYRYFNGLININPTYATEPDALVDYLRGYNGDREMTYVQHFGKELTDFFERMRSLPRENAVAEIRKRSA